MMAFITWIVGKLGFLSVFGEFVETAVSIVIAVGQAILNVVIAVVGFVFAHFKLIVAVVLCLAVIAYFGHYFRDFFETYVSGGLSYGIP